MAIEVEIDIIRRIKEKIITKGGNQKDETNHSWVNQIALEKVSINYHSAKVITFA